MAEVSRIPTSTTYDALEIGKLVVTWKEPDVQIIAMKASLPEPSENTSLISIAELGESASNGPYLMDMWKREYSILVPADEYRFVLPHQANFWSLNGITTEHAGEVYVSDGKAYLRIANSEEGSEFLYLELGSGHLHKGRPRNSFMTTRWEILGPGVACIWPPD